MTILSPWLNDYGSLLSNTFDQDANRLTVREALEEFWLDAYKDIDWKKVFEVKYPQEPIT
jgi:hypothetical protein